MSKLTIAAVILAALSLNACVPAAIGIGAAGGGAYWATQTESGQKTVQKLE